MKVWKSELEEARRCGVEIRFLTVPVEITGEKTVQSVRCRRTRLSEEPDSSGRRFPIEIEGSDFILACEAVIIAIGQEISAPFVKSFAHTGAGFVRIGEHFGTSIPGVFAGGDAVAGEGTIVQAVAHGKTAAEAIVAYLKRSPEGRP
jgi:NADPH-dependent glutamate synthase beta subunit-like oxidoreductase